MRATLVLVCFALFACTDSSGSGTADGEEAASARSSAPLRFAMIPKGTTHVFWTTVERGARAAADELGIELEWKGPLKESDRAAQIQIVQQFTSQKVDGLLLAPLDSRALLACVRAARQTGIPVMIFDSALEGVAGVDFAGFVATDNREAGRLAGRHLAELVGEEGDVVLLRYVVGSASTAEREAGFLDAVHAEPGLNVLVDNRYAGATAGDAKTQALNLLDPLRAAEGIFCSNESATYGMLLALRQVGLAGQVRFVGFDASAGLVEGLEQGEIDALVVQDPERMGALAVTELARHLRGEEIAPFSDTGAVLVTRENMHEPAIAALLR